METTSILEQAAKSNSKPSSSAVVEALLAAEKNAKKTKTRYSFEQLTGKWQLCFITGTKKTRKKAGIVLGAGRYIPEWIAKIQIAYSSESVAFIVGIARGVTVILNEGHVSDSILFYGANMVQGMPPAMFIILLMVFYIIFSLFIQSSSGMAVLTMPIIGALAIIVNIPGREIVNSYLFGMGIMSFVAPTGLILPSLALVNVSLKTWLKFITPLLFMLIVLCSLFLIVGIYL